MEGSGRHIWRRESTIDRGALIVIISCTKGPVVGAPTSRWFPSFASEVFLIGLIRNECLMQACKGPFDSSWSELRGFQPNTDPQGMSS